MIKTKGEQQQKILFLPFFPLLLMLYYLLLLSWHISKELINNLKRKGYKGKFIIPLPYPKIIN